MLILFLLIFATALNAQTKTIAVVPFTGGASGEGDTMARLLGSDLVKESRNAYRIAPRTQAINRILAEQKFQRNGLTDADTIAEIGKIANAQFVVTGHIKKIGSKNLVVASMTEIATLQQTAGYFSYYDDLSEMIELKEMAQRLINTTQKNAGTSSKILAVLPFEITVKNQASESDAETLAQILASSLANSGKYKVVLRTTTIERIMAEHKIQQSDLTSSESIQKIGEALNADYILAGFVSRLGSGSLMDAQILDVETAYQTAGDKVVYKTIDDGIDLMENLSAKITGGTTIEDIIRLCNTRAGQNGIAEIEELLETGDVNFTIYDNNHNSSSYDGGYKRHDIIQSVNDHTRPYGTPLMLASYYGYTEIVESLIDIGADINNYWFDDNNNALGFASARGHTAIVRRLISNGADVNIGCHALYGASLNGHTEIVKLLIAARVNVNSKCIYTDALKDFESEEGNYDNVRIIRSREYLAKASTPLIAASQNGHTEIVKLLIAARVNVNNECTYEIYEAEKGIDDDTEYLKQEKIATALVWASSAGHTEIVKLLISARANVNAEWREETTVDNDRTVVATNALKIATNKGHTEIVNMLKAAGAK